MQGPSYSNNYQRFNELNGILPRTARFIFQEFDRLNKFEYNYKMYISAVEIYNENIYDLFASGDEKTALTIFSIKNNVI